MQFLKYILLLCALPSYLFAYQIDKYNPARDKENVAALFKQEYKTLGLDELLYDGSSLDEIIEDTLQEIQNGPYQAFPTLFNPNILRMVIIFDNNGKFAGFCGYTVSKDYENFKTYIKICSIAIKPEFRRQGYATELLQHITQKIGLAIGAREAYLLTNADNQASRLLYEKFGFVIEDQNEETIVYAYKIKKPFPKTTRERIQFIQKKIRKKADRLFKSALGDNLLVTMFFGYAAFLSLCIYLDGKFKTSNLI